MSIKLELYDFCLEFVDNRFQIIQNTIKEIQESLLSETKSSAGDKHETGRAMIQLEQEKLSSQLSQFSQQKETISKLNAETKTVSGVANAIKTVPTSASASPFDGPAFPVVAIA